MAHNLCYNITLLPITNFHFPIASTVRVDLRATAVKELRQVVGEKASAQLKAAESDGAVETALKSAFSALLRCDRGIVQQQLSSLTGRLSTAGRLVALLVCIIMYKI